MHQMKEEYVIHMITREEEKYHNFLITQVFSIGLILLDLKLSISL